jgi:hypothetical protein
MKNMINKRTNIGASPKPNQLHLTLKPCSHPKGFRTGNLLINTLLQQGAAATHCDSTVSTVYSRLPAVRTQLSFCHPFFALFRRSVFSSLKFQISNLQSPFLTVQRFNAFNDFPL